MGMYLGTSRIDDFLSHTNGLQRFQVIAVLVSSPLGRVTDLGNGLQRDGQEHTEQCRLVALHLNVTTARKHGGGQGVGTYYVTESRRCTVGA